MTPMLSPQQREEVLEAMAEALDPQAARVMAYLRREITRDDLSEAERVISAMTGGERWLAAKENAAAALDAALPAITRAVLQSAVNHLEELAYGFDDEDAKGIMIAVRALRALAEEAR